MDIPYIGSIYETTGKSGSKLFTILPGFSMFLRNYAMFCDFKSANVAKRLGRSPRPRLLGVGVSHHAITFPPHLNPGSTPVLAKRKGTPLVSMYPLPNARGSSRIWPNSRGTPPLPPVPSLRHCFYFQQFIQHYGKILFGVLHLLYASIATFDNRPGSNPGAITFDRSFQIGLWVIRSCSYRFVLFVNFYVIRYKDTVEQTTCTFLRSIRANDLGKLRPREAVIITLARIKRT